MDPTGVLRVSFSRGGATWVKVLVSDSDPAHVLAWLGENTTGPWASRVPTLDELRQLGIEPKAEHFLVLAFQDEHDAQTFTLWRMPPKGFA